MYYPLKSPWWCFYQFVLKLHSNVKTKLSPDCLWWGQDVSWKIRPNCSTVLVDVLLSLPLCKRRFWANARCTVCKQSICQASRSFEPDICSLSLIREETTTFSPACTGYCLWASSWWCYVVGCCAPGCSRATWTETAKPRTPLKQRFAANQAMGSVQQRELLANWHKVSFSPFFPAVEFS